VSDKKNVSGKKAKPPEEDIDDKKMPLLDHLLELRTRLIWAMAAFLGAFLIGFYFSRPVFNFLAHPLLATSSNTQIRTLIYTSPLEGFVTYVHVGMFTGMCISFPIIANQIWAFVAPGLYRHEKQAFLPFLIATPFMFVLGGAVLYFLVLPVGLQFLSSFEQLVVASGDVPINFTPKMSEYLSFVMTMILAFGISFELPVLLLILVRIGVLSAEQLASKRRYAVVGVVVFAGIMTPPDVFSQVGLAIPLYLLYEGSIWVAKLIEKRRAEADAEAEAELDEELFGHDKPAAATATAGSGTTTAALPAPTAIAPPAAPRPPPIDETDFNTR
jgi:sec-independent protein translocase protein TatC